MWPFKSKPKAKPEPEVKPEPVVEPQKLVIVPPAPRWEDRIAAAISKRGRLLRDELDSLTALDVVPEDCDLEAIYGLVKPLFDRATNNSTCPCRIPEEIEKDEKHTFKTCCKTRTKELQGMLRFRVSKERREREEAEAEAKKERLDERTRANVSWMVKIGQNEKGQIMMDPLDGSKQFTMRNVCDAIEICAWQAREMILIEAVKSKVLSELYRASQQNPSK